MEDFQGIIIKEPDNVQVDSERNKMFRIPNNDILFKRVTEPQQASISLFNGGAIEIQEFAHNIVIIMKHERSGHRENTLITEQGLRSEKGVVIFANCENRTKGEITGLSAEQVEYLIKLYSLNVDLNTFTNGFYE